MRSCAASTGPRASRAGISSPAPSPRTGNAALSLEGIVNNPDHSVNNAYRGKSYSYRVRATFEPSVGTGQRVGKRKCSFRFDRRS